MDYRREIDGLRALAVVPVVLFHAGSPIPGGGYVGVDVFFVISGYLITSIILADLKCGRFSILNFYERRARRILPALFVLVLVCFPVAWLCLLPDDMQDFTQSLAAVSLFISNLLFLQESGYFDAAAELKPLLHTWSLAVEEQYYLIFPAVLVLVWRLQRKWVFPLLASIAASSLLLAQWASHNHPEAAFYLLPTRAWELMAGGLAALHHSRHPKAHPRRNFREVGSGLGILLILYAMTAYDRRLPFPNFALLPVCGAVLVILLADKDTLVGKFLGLRIMVGIGLVSYSAYLWHHPLFAFARHASTPEPGAALVSLLAAASFGVAYLSWRFIETPFRSRVQFSRRQILLYSIVGSFCILWIGLAGHFSGGFIGRFDKQMEGSFGHLDFYRHIETRFPDCEPASIASKALTWDRYLRCKQSRQGKPQVVLLGDSHAEHLFVGLAEEWSDLNVVYYIQGGPPYLSNPQFSAIFDEILSNDAIQTVILTMHYAALVSDSEELYREFAKAVDRLQAAHKKVILVGDIPRYQISPFACALAKSNNSCHLSWAEADLQRNVYHSALQRLSAEKGIPYVDLHAPICNQGGCSMVNGKAVVYRDRNHLNVLGSRLVGDYLADQLRN